MRVIPSRIEDPQQSRTCASYGLMSCVRFSAQSTGFRLEGSWARSSGLKRVESLSAYFTGPAYQKSKHLPVLVGFSYLVYLPQDLLFGD